MKNHNQECEQLPLGEKEFADLMTVFEPFEAMPRLAVGLSGGGDSMALCLLADRWARNRHGYSIAFIVDHQLRRNSCHEVRLITARLHQLNIAHDTLIWHNPKATSAAAREARFLLLTEACRRHGILHLLLAHQAEDQIETLLIRLASGSGLLGLAAMAPLTERGFGRILRPLLTTPRMRLRAYLRHQSEGWLEDPSNKDIRFARARLRAHSTTLSRAGLTSGRLIASISNFSQARRSLEEEVARLALLCIRIDPGGLVWIEAEPLLKAPSPLLQTIVLGNAIAIAAGRPHRPRSQALSKLAEYLRIKPKGSARTLGGAVIHRRGSMILIGREQKALAPPILLTALGNQAWDGRFRSDGCRLRGQFWVHPLRAQGELSYPALLPKMFLDKARCLWPLATARYSLPSSFRQQRSACFATSRLSSCRCANRDCSVSFLVYSPLSFSSCSLRGLAKFITISRTKKTDTAITKVT